MSDATRAVALTQAVTLAVAAGLGAAETVEIAESFNTFMNGDRPAAPASTGGAVAPAATPTKTPPKPAAKPAADKPAAKPADDSAKKAAADKLEAQKTRVGAIVSQLLEADRRAEAVALLKKFGATSVSGVKAKDYTTFITEGDELLGGSEETADLTA
jgi:hypothetical protein